MTRFRALVLAVVLAVVTVGLSVGVAEAAVARVYGISSIERDHYRATIRIQWKQVRGATYQVRWAPSKAALKRAKRFPASTNSATSPWLNRCGTTYVQVRAIKRSKAGPWSRPRAVWFPYQRPKVGELIGAGISNGVNFSWDYVPAATRYRVRWNAGPFGKFPGGDSAAGGGWLNQGARSVDLTFPSTPRAGDKMMGVAYANPVFVKFDVNNACRPTKIPWTPYVPVFPAAPDPGTGDDIRSGTYNVELFPSGGSRIAGIARNIVDHGLDVVMLQEANDETRDALLQALGSGWDAAPSVRLQAQQILFRKDKFWLRNHGTFDVPNPKPGANDLITPWARLGQVNPSSQSKSQGLLVVSVHLAENPSATAMSKKASAGAAARFLMSRIDTVNYAQEPVISGGDYRYLREPFGDVAGFVEAPPTMVRGGYYDAMAAVTKIGYQYTTVNGRSTQSPSSAGVASRADYLMLKGFNGSRTYRNVYNWKYNGSWVSDHNLVYADVTIPYK